MLRLTRTSTHLAYNKYSTLLPHQKKRAKTTADHPQRLGVYKLQGPRQLPLSRLRWAGRQGRRRFLVGFGGLFTNITTTTALLTNVTFNANTTGTTRAAISATTAIAFGTSGRGRLADTRLDTCGVTSCIGCNATRGPICNIGATTNTSHTGLTTTLAATNFRGIPASNAASLVT